MRKYFFKKITVSLLLLALCRASHSVDAQTIECSPETIDQLCNSQNQVAVCVLNNQGAYQTYSSPCEACGHQQTLRYTQGSCTCPDLPCDSQQTCVKGECLIISELDVNELTQLAYKYLSQQKHKEALQFLQKALQTTQENSNLFYLSSLAAFGNDQPKESLKFIKKAIMLNPQVPEFYIIRGRAFSEIDQFEEAERQFQKVLGMGFDDIGLVYFYQAQNLLKSQRNQQAIRKFESALKFHPQKTEWYLRKALAHLINKEQKMALLTCREGLKIDPNNEQIKLFMKQFKIIDEGKQRDLEKAQQKSQIPADSSKEKIDPEYISRLIQEKKQEEIMNFEKQRLAQKIIKQQKQIASKEKKLNQDLQL